MKKITQLSLSFAAFSAAALCAGYLLHKKGLLSLRRTAEPEAALPAPEVPAQPTEKATPEPEPPAKRTFRSAQLNSDLPVPPADDVSPIIEFQLVEPEEIKA